MKLLITKRSASTRWLQLLLLLIIVLSATGCATKQFASKEQDDAAKQFNPPADKSLIYVMRRSGIRGQAVHLSISLDRKIVGVIQKNTYIVLETEPGNHTLEFGTSVSNVEGRIDLILPSNLKLETLPGRVYFIIGNLTMSRPDVEIISDEQGRKLLVQENYKRVVAIH